MTANERISVLIDTLGLKQKDFADRIKLKPNTLSMIKNNKRNVTDRVISDIVREFNVNEQWLIYGTGEIFKSEPINYIDNLVKQYKLSDKDKKILESYVNMPEENRNLFFNFISAINLQEKEKSQE